MTLKFSLLLVACFIVGVCRSQQKSATIKGTLTGFDDGTLVYLYEVRGHGAYLKDSTQLKNGAFKFATDSVVAPIQNMIRIKSSTDYKYFWIDGPDVTFNAQKGEFRKAVISGSATQKEQDEFDSVAGDDKEKSIAFIRNHPNSLISVYVLNVYAPTWGKEITSRLYDLLYPEKRKTSYGKEVLTFIQLNKNPQIGDNFADFTAPDTAGRMIHLSDFKGKVMLLDFWGSWCVPCRQNNPELVKLYHEFRSKGFEIVGVASELTKEDWLEAIKKDGLTWTNVSDLQGMNSEPAMIYSVNKYPSNFLIDRSGTIVATDLHGDDLRNKVIALLKK